MNHCKMEGWCHWPLTPAKWDRSPECGGQGTSQALVTKNLQGSSVSPRVSSRQTNSAYHHDTSLRYMMGPTYVPEVWFQLFTIDSPGTAKDSVGRWDLPKTFLPSGKNDCRYIFPKG